MGEDGICIHMNVSGKRQARYQMLTIYGLLEVNGDVLLDLQHQSDQTQTQLWFRSSIRSYNFPPPPNSLRFAAAAYYGILCLQIQNIQGCHFLQFVCL